jgi:pilus assembly protein CpaF
MMNRFGRRAANETPLANAVNGVLPRGEAPAPPQPDEQQTYQPSQAAAEARAKTGRVSLQTLVAIHREVLDRVDPTEAARMPAPELMVRVERLISQIADERNLSLNQSEQRGLASDIVDDMLGLGPIEAILRDETVNDILVNGSGQVYVEQRGKLALTNIRFRDESHVLNIAQKIASSVGRRIDESSPMVDARLSDGSRVNIVIPPLALNGTCISIRKFTRNFLDFRSLVEKKSMSSSMARFLEIASRCRLNIVVSGGTGSGKTTLLNAMSSMIDPGERIVTIEDAAELQFRQPHVVRLETRPANVEGHGQVTQRDLVKNALRMRPDRIIIGEVRTGEAFDMIQAMNTGHDGSMSSIHANTPRDAIARLESMVMMANLGLPSTAVRQQIVSAIDLLVQVERMRDGSRRIVQIAEVVGREGDTVITQDLFEFKFTGQSTDGRLIGNFEASGIRPRCIQRIAYYGLDDAVMEAVRGEIG